MADKTTQTTVMLNKNHADFFLRQVLQPSHLIITDQESAVSMAKVFVDSGLWDKACHSQLLGAAMKSFDILKSSIDLEDGTMRQLFISAIIDELAKLSLYQQLVLNFEEFDVDFRNINAEISLRLNSMVLGPFISENNQTWNNKRRFASARNHLRKSMERIDFQGEILRSFFEQLLKYGDNILDKEILELLEHEIPNCAHERTVVA